MAGRIGFGFDHPTIGAAACAAASLAACAIFIPKQSIWIDETTQLTGLAMGPGEVAAWLIDPLSRDMGVPGDRMPPLGYWLGQLWAAVFGLTETSMRWFGAVCAAGAAALVFDAARRAFGLRAGWAAGLLFALSPNVVMLAVEIRPYGLLLLASAGAFHALVRLLADEEPTRGRWAALAAWLVLAMWVHFYGVVAGACVLTVLLVRAVWLRHGFAPVLVCGGVCAVAAAVLVPFVAGSVRMSQFVGDLEQRNRFAEIARLFYRFVAHPTMAVYGAVAAAALFGAAVLAAAGLVAQRRQRGGRFEVAAVVGLGLGVSIAANFVLKDFQASKITYNAWLVPGLLIVLSAGLAAARRPLRVAAAGGAALLMACQLSGLAQLAVRGEWFAHSPYKAVCGALGGLAPAGLADTAVIHDGPGAGFLFFPLRYTYGDRLEQYWIDPDARPGRPGFRGAAGPVDPVALPHRYIAVLTAEHVPASEFAGMIRSGGCDVTPGPACAAMTASGRRPVLRRTYPGLHTVRLDVFEFTEPQPSRNTISTAR